MHVLVREQVERGLGVFVADDFAELGAVVVADRGVQRGRAHGSDLELAELGTINADFFGEFVVRGFTAQFFGHRHGHTAHLADLVHHVDRKADGLGLIGEGALDGLFDPPGGVG